MIALGSSLLAPFNARQREIIGAANQWGYFDSGLCREPTLYRGRKLLDIGMGGGPHSVAFIVGGASGYVGVDPEIGSEMVTDFRSEDDPSIPNYGKFPYSPDEIMAAFPTVRLYPGYAEAMADRLKGLGADLVALSYVSEHLRHPEKVIAAAYEAAADGAALWVSHGNYASWCGHHLEPREVDQIDRDNPVHRRNIDWRHLEPSHPAYAKESLNRMRLRDFRILIEKYFRIVQWREHLDGVELLTPEIRRRWKKYPVSELLARTVYVYGIRRATPEPTDLSGLIFFHPPADYRDDEDYSGETDDHIKSSNLVYFERPRSIGGHSYNNDAGAKILGRMKPGDRMVLQKHGDIRTVTLETIHRTGDQAWVSFVEDVPEECYDANSQEWTIVEPIRAR